MPVGELNVTSFDRGTYDGSIDSRILKNEMVYAKIKSNAKIAQSWSLEFIVHYYDEFDKLSSEPKIIYYPPEAEEAPYPIMILAIITIIIILIILLILLKKGYKT